MARKRSIRRTLIYRLFILNVCLAAVIAPAVYLLQFHEAERSVLDRAAASVAQFRWLILEQLDSPGLGDHTRIQSALERSISGPALPTDVVGRQDGQFVRVRILNRDFKEVAGANRAQDDLSAVMQSAESSLNRAALEQRGFWGEMKRLGGRNVIHAAVALRDSAGVVVGYADGLFVLSPEFYSRARTRVAFFALAAVCIVVLTTLLLYPVISRLLMGVTRLSGSLLHANIEILSVLGSAIAKRDSDTDSHNYRVTLYSLAIAEQMGLDSENIRTLLKGAFLHDVGKIGVRDSILLKPGKLSGDEYEEMKKHVRYGVDIIAPALWLSDAAAVVAAHHERFDGTGYDRQLRGNDIPSLARIFAIADVFDALTSRRPYKEPLGFEESMQILAKDRGSHFDPGVFDAFAIIAASLYSKYVNSSVERLRQDLKAVMGRYFSAETAEYMY